jgi:hypothetical protein
VKQASSVRLADLVRAEERGEFNLINPLKEPMQRDIDEHIHEYLLHLKTKGVNPVHLAERERLVRLVLRKCGIKTLADLAADKITAYLAVLQKHATPNNLNPGQASARTKDTHRGAVHAFAEWCVNTRPQRLKENPIRACAKPKGDVVHARPSQCIHKTGQFRSDHAAGQRQFRTALTSFSIRHSGTQK